MTAEAVLECVLFDLDGLLVDSEPLQYRAYHQAFADHGLELSMADWIDWHAAEASTRRWVEKQGLDLDVEQLRDCKKVYYDELIRHELDAKPGVVELVRECADRYRLAVVSASRRESIEACLEKIGVHAHFDILVSGSEVTRSKPYPDPYLEAMRILDTSAVQAIALEDSQTGFRAAAAAGLACVVCPDHFIPKPADAFEAAALVVGSLEELDAGRLHRVHHQHHSA